MSLTGRIHTHLQKQLTLRVAVTTLLAAWASPAVAQSTIVQERISQMTRLIPLRKVTVGPDDQYQGSWDPAHQRLIFTRKSDLAPHLCVQDLKTGKITPLVGQDSDSQEATLNANGDIAFTSFREHATGDICILPAGSQGQADEKSRAAQPYRCLKQNSEPSERSNPFWKSPTELGFLVRDPSSGVNEIWLEDLKTTQRTLLHKGQVWSPAVSQDGKWLAYNAYSQGTDQQRVLILHSLLTGEKKEFRFALPGTSGFPKFAPDGSHLIFSHYLNDTNSDGTVDGNDNSVLFRVKLSEAGRSEPVLPEQLTSVETNCSYPSVSWEGNSELLATCAFEGTLDLYHLPLTGVVPANWTEAQIRNAHQTARTYAERILLLNTLRSRFPKTWNRKLEEQLFSNHYFAGDSSSARFYAVKLGPSHALLDLLLEAIEIKKAEPTDEITRGLIAEILKIDTEIQKRPRSRLSLLVRGHLEMLLNRARGAQPLLEAALKLPVTRDEEQILALELARWTYPSLSQQNGKAGGFPPPLLNVYLESFLSSHLSEEARLAVTFDFLKNLEERESSLSLRSGVIQSALSRLPGDLKAPVRILLDSELKTLEVIQAATEDQKAALYTPLDRLITDSRANFFLRKAIATRAVMNFAKAADFTRLGYVASQWLRFTPDSDTEFANAREAFALASLDHGYARLGANQLDLASNYFYSSLSLTDDLESHAGYIHVAVQKGNLPAIREKYSLLKKRQFVSDNLNFADALIPLESERTSSHRDSAIEKLENLTQERDSSIRHLYLGSLLLEKLLESASGYEFDLKLSERAHQHLMLAYDLGRDNDRVKATALSHLGLLHARIQNHGLATQYFAKRAELPFLTPEDRAQWTWRQSASLIKSYQSEEAAVLLQEFLSSEAGKALTKSERLPFRERKAFALLVAKKWKDAANEYEAFLKDHPVSEEANLARIQLAYGSALFEAGSKEKAVPVLKQALTRARALQARPRLPHELVGFEPRRITLTALGFLAQTGTEAERREALAERETLLRGAKDILDSWNASLAQNLVQQAELLQTQDRSLATRKIAEALKHAQDYAKEYQYLAHAVFQTTRSALGFYLLHPEQASTPEGSQAVQLLEKMIQESLKTYDRQPFPQALWDAQRLRLSLLWAAFERDVLKRAAVTPPETEVTSSESFKRIQSTLPQEAQSLALLYKGLFQ